MREILSFNLQSISTKKKLLIYGASIGGEITYKILQKNNIPVWGICDRAKDGQMFCDVQVMHPEEALAESDLCVLVTVTRAFNSVMKYLDNYPEIEIYEIGELLKDETFDYAAISYDENAVQDYLKKYKYYVEEYKDDGKIILPTFDIVVSEKCTLRCKDCSALVPYFKKPNTYQAQDIIGDYEKIRKMVDYVIELVIVGGEPFVYPEICELIEYFVSVEEIGEITIVSNATVLPSEKLQKALQNEKVRVRFSEYGLKMQKFDQLKEIFELKGINYYIQKLDFWLDMGAPQKRNYDPKMLEKVFTDCAFSRSQGVLDGKIFRCMHAAEIYNLKRIEMVENKDYIQVRDNQEKIEIQKENLRNYLFKIPSIILCDYCSGTSQNEKGIRPAIQIGE